MKSSDNKHMAFAYNEFLRLKFSNFDKTSKGLKTRYIKWKRYASNVSEMGAKSLSQLEYLDEKMGAEATKSKRTYSQFSYYDMSKFA
ncbi:Hypothetical predicted protein [Octopus vulgaris]|uniref:Uncharacterized protein n=1 Tax=Octopus vulgaris TaxID=6645 RepID=A0AA36BB75_OCTVU|nr:Hypothetical predicted protein [Octopus vulgaris]